MKKQLTRGILLVAALLVIAGVTMAAFNFYPGCSTCDITLRTATITTANVTNSTVTGTESVNGGTIGGCTWTVTLASGAGTSSGTACLAQCKNINVLSVAGILDGGAPTTLATPTAGVNNVACAQPAAASTVVKCLSNQSGSSAVITGNCAN